MLKLPLLAAIACLTVPTQAPALDRAVAWFATREAEFVAFRHDLHQHPELSGAEGRTAGAVAARLKAAGLEVTTGIGGHGLTARLRGGRPGPLVAYRADMDAVRSSAPDPAPYASTIPGVRHICGHDVHTAIAVALAESLAAVRADIPGSVLFIFQPAEESATGADAMLAAGVFARETPRRIFGLHTAPLNVGQLAIARTVMMPARDRVTVTVPNAAGRSLSSIQAALAAAGTLGAAQGFGPVAGDFVVYDNGAVRAAAAPPQVEANYTVSGPAAREALRKRLDQALSTFGSDLTRTHTTRVAGVTNHPEAVDRAVRVLRDVLGEPNVRVIETMVPAFSEDFGSFQAQVPGAFFFLGVSNPAKNTAGMPHSPDYVADDGAIAVGVRAMAAVLLDALENSLNSARYLIG